MLAGDVPRLSEQQTRVCFPTLRPGRSASRQSSRRVPPVRCNTQAHERKNRPIHEGSARSLPACMGVLSSASSQRRSKAVAAPSWPHGRRCSSEAQRARSLIGQTSSPGRRRRELRIPRSAGRRPARPDVCATTEAGLRTRNGVPLEDPSLRRLRRSCISAPTLSRPHGGVCAGSAEEQLGTISRWACGVLCSTHAIGARHFERTLTPWPTVPRGPTRARAGDARGAGSRPAAPADAQSLERGRRPRGARGRGL